MSHSLFRTVVVIGRRSSPFLAKALAPTSSLRTKGEEIGGSRYAPRRYRAIYNAQHETRDNEKCTETKGQ